MLVFTINLKAIVLCIALMSHVSLAFHKDGILLLEADRLLRAGGYFVWAAQPVYKHEEILQDQWKGIFSDIIYSMI